MEKRQKDTFREALEKARQTAAWAKLSLPQKEELVTKYLLRCFETSGRQQE